MFVCKKEVSLSYAFIASVSVLLVLTLLTGGSERQDFPVSLSLLWPFIFMFC